MERIRLLCIITVLIGAAFTDAQNLPEYTCWKTTQPVTIDGSADEAAWQQAAAMPLWDVRYITDPQRHTRPTEARILWDDDNLYIFFLAADPDVWSVLTERDADLWNDEVVEIFFDPMGEGMNYAEFEVNPLNTVLDLLVTRSPSRKSFFEWNAELYTATQVGGTVNNHEDTDQHWSMEMALPWQSLVTDLIELTGDRSLPPVDGDVWRFNFYRYERLRTDGRETRNNIEYSAWSPTGEINFHMPERFGIVTFKEGQTAVERSSWGRLKADR